MKSVIDRVRQVAANAAVVISIGAVCAGTATAAGFEPPPISSQPSSEHHVGKMVWGELVTPDIAAAERFYGGLFGWTFRDVGTDDMHYAVALLGGEPVAGLIHHPIKSGEKHQPSWITFLAVQDVDAAKTAILKDGGKVLREPRTYNARGRQAIFADPQGAAFAVIASYSGDTPDFLAAPGAWIWSSLLTHDLDKEAAFYQTVFGYEVFDLESNDGMEHVILSTDDYARASVNALPADAARRHPHWLNFVRVADAADAATRAVALGGSVLVAPRVDRHGGKLAVIADPAGAPFGVMEWNDADGKGEAK
ncbi:MAG: VOC family protein [Steroidobacteraceae bacterium]|jgi:predicted enzyme related to lactoylglutathione lyase